MPTQQRSYRNSAQQDLLLKSTRALSKDGSSWELTLELYGPGRIRRRLIERRQLKKSGEWSTSSIELLQAQEELEMLQSAAVDIVLMDLIRGA